MDKKHRPGAKLTDSGRRQRCRGTETMVLIDKLTENGAHPYLEEIPE